MSRRQITKNFVEQTRNYQAFLNRMAELEEFSDSNARILAVTSRFGLGKTEMALNYCRRFGHIYIHALPSWSIKNFYMEICRALTMPEYGTLHQLRNRVLDELVLRGKTLVVDEAGNLLFGRRAQEMEAELSHLLDQTSNRLVLIGNESVQQFFDQEGRLQSRCGMKLRLEPNSRQDVAAYIGKCFGVENLDPKGEVVRFIFERCPTFREMSTFISRLTQEKLESIDLPTVVQVWDDAQQHRSW